MLIVLSALLRDIPQGFTNDWQHLDGDGMFRNLLWPPFVLLVDVDHLITFVYRIEQNVSDGSVAPAFSILATRRYLLIIKHVGYAHHRPATSIFVKDTLDNSSFSFIDK